MCDKLFVWYITYCNSIASTGEGSQGSQWGESVFGF